jgi:D-beta-D-heptose 7-phosphate kinase/D-beta-D-heptose 1-phosphate adenosyltransferase
VSEKLKTLDELTAITAKVKSTGKKIVLTNGCFDILHRGHVHLLREAKKYGDVLVVALNSDRSVKTIKGPTRPVLPQEERIELIAAMEPVDYVVVFDEADPYEVISQLRPDVLAKGGDWSKDKIIGSDIVEQNGGTVAVIPYLKGFSSTEIIERIRN